VLRLQLPQSLLLLSLLGVALLAAFGAVGLVARAVQEMCVLAPLVVLLLL
jgi:hypothetical protein